MKPSLAALPVLGAAGAVAVVLASGASGQTASTPQVIHLVQVKTKFHFVDTPPLGGERKPPTPGDQFILSGADQRSGKIVGQAIITCVVAIGGAKGQSECTGSASLGTGSLTFQGDSHTDSNGDTFAVTGGTGTYAGASGSLVAKDGGGGKEDITITLK